MSTDRFHAYRGDLRGIATVGGDIVFVTAHAEGQPTAIYHVDAADWKMISTALPAGGAALLSTPEGLWVAGTDGNVYFQDKKGNAPVGRGPHFESAPVALAALAGGRLAVAVGETVRVLARADGAELQSLSISEEVTCLAADASGQWLAVGGAKGTVAVFETETDSNAFQQSDAATLHEAAVTALLFEADELRVLSAGADQKLLSTHARGRLEAEDRGRGFMHEQPVAALAAGPGGRFFSGSADASVKSWPPGRGGRPVTQKDGVGKVVGLAVLRLHEKYQLAVACADNTIRFFHLDDEAKFGVAGIRLHGLADWAKNELAASDRRRAEAALRRVAEFADGPGVELIGKHMDHDPDNSIRLVACQLLGESKHPRAPKALENGLRNREAAVRLHAFDGLRRQAGADELRPMALALKTEKADVGQRAVEVLEGLAKQDGRALAHLVEALDSKATEVRTAALDALEKVHATDSPEASLVALGSSQADVRRRALVRLFQRKLLHDPRVQATLRWRGDDPDAEVRRVAFLVSLYTRERLVRALRERDPELNRQLTELEEGGLPAMKAAPAPPAAAEVAAPADAGDIDGVISELEGLASAGRLPGPLAQQIGALRAMLGSAIPAAARKMMFQNLQMLLERMRGREGKP